MVLEVVLEQNFAHQIHSFPFVAVALALQSAEAGVEGGGKS